MQLGLFARFWNKVWTKFGKDGDDKTWESNEVKLLGVTIDKKLRFGSHIANIYVKANYKLTVLSSLANLLTFDEKPDSSFFVSQFKLFVDLDSL